MYKLKKRFQFQSVYKKGRFLKEDNITFYFLMNGLSYNRIGISASSTIAPLSVKRNRCKRLLLESYRQTEGALKKGYDIILMIKKDISNLNLENVRNEVIRLCKMCGILA